MSCLSYGVSRCGMELCGGSRSVRWGGERVNVRWKWKWEMKKNKGNTDLCKTSDSHTHLTAS